MPGGLLAIVELSFEPTVHLFGLVVRWQAVVIAGGVLLALVLAARLVRRESPRLPGLAPLRLDDLLYVALGAVPGAIVGARLVHALGFLEVYAAQPGQSLDPALGGYSLLGAVLGGTLSAAYLASLLEGTVRRWADVAAAPLLLAIGVGKVGEFLGGGGQGAFFDGSWAVAFTGTGPWLSAAASVPAHPVALYEAVWALLGVPLVVWATRGAGASWRPFVVALCWFLVGRAVLGTFWRDDRLIGPVNVEQTLAALVLAVIVAAALARRALPHRVDPPAPVSGG